MQSQSIELKNLGKNTLSNIDITTITQTIDNNYFSSDLTKILKDIDSKWKNNHKVSYPSRPNNRNNFISILPSNKCYVIKLRLAGVGKAFGSKEYELKSIDGVILKQNTLVPEPENPWDKHAIAVYSTMITDFACLLKEEKRIGYIPKNINQDIKFILDKVQNYTTEIYPSYWVEKHIVWADLYIFLRGSKEEPRVFPECNIE